MSKKIAQNTTLDAAKPYQHRYNNYYDDRRNKPVLPFEDFNTRYEMERSQEELARKKDESVDEPLSLNYPELGPDYFKYRNLNQEEIARLKQEDEKERVVRQTYYYGNQEDRNKPQNQSIYDLNEQLSPEDAKRKIYARYQKFREIAAIFYTYYKEANQFVEDFEPINYEASYLQIVKDFPKYLISLIKKEVGQLFGLVPEGRSYHHQDRAKKLYEFINRGINVFNITPETYDEKMKELESAMVQMKVIMEAYNKRKKVLDKLPAILDQSSKEFLVKTKNRDFLKWMEEYFPSDKKEFIDDSIRNMFDTYRSSSGERKYFTLGDLHKIKSYKSIHDKMPNASGPFVFNRLQDKATKEIKNHLSKEMITKTHNKLNTLEILLRDIPYDNLSIESLRPIYVYCNKAFKLDLKSILSFTEELSVKYYKENYEADWLVENNVLETQRTRFIKSFTENLDEKIKGLTKNDYKFDGIITSFVEEIISRHTKDDRLQTKEISKLTDKDLDTYVGEYMREVVVDSLPNFARGTSWDRTKDKTDGQARFPNMIPLANIIKETGKFTVDGIMTYITKAMPFIPRDFVLQLARFLFKGVQSQDANKVLSTISSIEELSGTDVSGTKPSMQILLDILKKSGKLNANTFVSVFTEHFEELRKSIQQFKSDLPNKFNDKQVKQIFLTAIRSAGTIGQDIKNLNQFVSFVHNDADELSTRDIMMILNNVNFHSFAKLGIVKKVISAYSAIKDEGGMSAIKKKYNRIINDMIKNKYISANFYQNMILINNFFNSNQPINPSSEMFNQLFEAASSVETDLEIIEMGETFKELLVGYEKKDERLFNLDLRVGDSLRFRVLKDMDPRTLRIGIETNCCQRIGGAAESAAKDSFVNPLAGVVILEWKDGDDWKLLSQSYFHYVPPKEIQNEQGEKSEDGNGYILDNIETNRENVKESGIDIPSAYAYLANYIRNKFGIKYFLAGKGYSKINTDGFETYNMEDGEDPRSFSPKALGGYRSKPYTDFSPYESMDLLKPTNQDSFDNFKSSIGESKEKEKRALLFNMRRIILGNISFARC